MYVDGTLILAVNNEDAEIYMQCIEQAGRMYGLQLNWNKLVVLPLRCEHASKNPASEFEVRMPKRQPSVRREPGRKI